MAKSQLRSAMASARSSLVGLLPSVLLSASACVTPSDWDSAVPKDDVERPDTDGDTIVDFDEGWSDPEVGSARDTDGDGKPDFEDLDSDDDGITDAVEAGDSDKLTLPLDTDSDGSPDFIDLDSDANCIPDASEGATDDDVDGLPAFKDLDDDGDGLLDSVEIGEACAMPDSDGDGTPDYHDLDSDDDGVADAYEGGASEWNPTPDDTDNDGTPDYLDHDSDGDGFSDSEEAGGGAEPRDTDGDGTYDFKDEDSDSDGLGDAEERDTFHTDPYADDTDGDGFGDGAEVSYGSNPLDGAEGIDGIYVVVPERTSVEEDFDFALAIQMADIGFMLDSTGSMGSTLNAVAGEFSTLTTEISAALPDAQYGVSHYNDYNTSGYGSSGDHPFYMTQQITDSSAAVQTALSSLYAFGGGDWEESAMEGLYQALTGVGYDLNCDNAYDTNSDVLPFISGASDAFGGTTGQSYNSASSGGGLDGGLGFRDYALPILVYATDAPLRDSDAGYPVPAACSNPATGTMVANAAGAMGAYLIGVGTTSTPITQMNNLADATGSLADTDGDGLVDDRLVFTWSGSSATLRSTIVKAIEDLVGSVKFDHVTLQVDNDPYGFVSDISPEEIEVSGTAAGEAVTFALTFRGVVAATEEDQVYTITLNVLGDDTVLLDTIDVVVIVPGRGA